MPSFQALPLLIFEKIFSYAIQDCNDNVNSYISAYGPLSQLCQIWRQVVFEYVLSSYEIEIRRKNTLEGMRTWPRRLGLPVASVGSWVKRLYVTVEFPMLNPGAKRFKGDKVMFTSAQYLEICVYHVYYKKRLSKSAVADINRLVQYLQKIAPNVKDVKIRHKSFSARLEDEDYQNHYTDLVCLLLNRFPKRKLELDCNFLQSLEVGGIGNKTSELTHLELSGGSPCKKAEMICKCSITLQVLEIRGYCMESILFNMLASPTTGEYLVYPRMKDLKITFQQHYSDYKGPYPTFPGAVPFPDLQKMELDGVYPLGDDVLFRGSQHSLRSIDINLTFDWLSQPANSHTFTGSIPYRYLGKVVLSTVPNVFNNDDYLQEIFDIGRQAKFLRFKGHCRDTTTVETVITYLGGM